MIRAFGFIFMLATALGLSGCVSVQPWQKEVLSRPIMQFGQSRTGEPFVTHALSTIEQAEGGESGNGGGCGCR